MQMVVLHRLRVLLTAVPLLVVACAGNGSSQSDTSQAGKSVVQTPTHTAVATGSPATPASTAPTPASSAAASTVAGGVASKTATPPATAGSVAPVTTPVATPPSVVAMSSHARWAVDMVDEETLQPFSSWANVKSDYGAVGDGVADDTIALQSALNDLGRAGKSEVVYLPAGVYKITATLTLTGSSQGSGSSYGWGGVGIYGADPATTSIKWAGPAGQPMLVQNGGFGTRYGRLTWDGSKSAGYGVAQWWNTVGGGIYGGGSEHQDEVFEDMNIGIMAGRLGANYGQLDSEGQIRRVSFVRNTYAGLDLGSYNALDWWVWDSHFIDCARGVSNQYSVNDAGVTTGAGAVYVYRSLFERSTVADMSLTNTGWFSLHNNVSVGSRRFFEATPLGDNSAVVIVEGNRVVQSTNPVPISLGNLGPLLLIDNQIQASSTTYELTDFTSGRDVLSMGNQVTAAAPTPSGSDRLLSIDDTAVSASSISTQLPSLPATPSVAVHQVYEVPAGATADQIQALIAQSALSTDSQPIVHFGHNTWTLNKTLQIPRNSTVQLVGDGYGSQLVWSGTGSGPMLSIAAPGKVTVRDLQWLGATATAIAISGADQPGGRIQVVGSQPGPLAATHLEQTQLSLQANSSIVSIAFSDVMNAVAMSNGVVGLVNLTAGSTFLMADTWYEGSDTALFRMPSASFTYLGGHMAPATHPGATNLAAPAILLDNFAGSASWIGMEFDLSAIPSGVGIQIESPSSQGQAYFMGITSNRANYFQAAAAGAGTGYTLNRTVQGTADVQAVNLGSSAAQAIRSTWSQARSLAWDTSPYQVPAASTDIRLYHVKMDQTNGLVIGGQ